MPLTLTCGDIALRLALTMLAGAVIGFNRGGSGHAAGFRTTMLVGLAAAVAMIQTNLLLPMAGKTAGSFAVIDLMRLPLGILTGVGFIGGGAILMRGELVTGVTTAATLWMITVIGLCLGGGQIGLGIAATLLAIFTLWLLKSLDRLIPREHRASLVIITDEMALPDLEGLVKQRGYHAKFQAQRRTSDGNHFNTSFDVAWIRKEASAGPPAELLAQLEQHVQVESLVMSEARG
jgi:putative Mg2+ transporter-C (MgtC) family protein